MQSKLDSIEIEIDNQFFATKLLPRLHKALLSNIKLESTSFFNLAIALRLSLLYESVRIEEYHFILTQLVTLRQFWFWRNPQHTFVNENDIVDKRMLTSLKTRLITLYPEKTKNVFYLIDKKLGNQFSFRELSIIFSTNIVPTFKLTPIEAIAFGFLCPSHEFQAKLTLFMY